MNSSFQNVNMTTLQDAEWESFLNTAIPFTVVLSTFGIIGTFGNITVLFTIQRWTKPSNYKILISFLAIIDLLSCSIGIPLYVLGNRFRYSYRSDVVCKVSSMFQIFVGVGSLNVLTFTSLERYRKTCKPLGKQFSLKQTKIVSCCLLGQAIILSLLSMPSFGSKTTEIHLYGNNITVYNCVYEKHKTYSKVYNFIFVLGLVVSIAICTSLYSLVGRAIILQSKRRPKMETYRYKPESNTKVCDRKGMTSHEDNNVGSQSTLSSVSIVSSKQDVSKIHGQHITMSNMAGKSLYYKSTQISFMFLVCSFLACASFVPLLVYRCMYSFDSLSTGSIFHSLDPYAKILYRSHVFNHVVNPIVYCFISNNFRKECQRLFCKRKT